MATDPEPMPLAAPTFAAVRTYGTWTFGYVTSNAGKQAWMVQGGYVAPSEPDL